MDAKAWRVEAFNGARTYAATYWAADEFEALEAFVRENPRATEYSVEVFAQTDCPKCEDMLVFGHECRS